MSTLYLESSLSTRALLRSGQEVPALSSMVRTFHAPIVTDLTRDVLLLLLLPQNGETFQPRLAGQGD